MLWCGLSEDAGFMSRLLVDKMSGNCPMHPKNERKPFFKLFQGTKGSMTVLHSPHPPWIRLREGNGSWGKLPSSTLLRVARGVRVWAGLFTGSGRS